eukprot:scaffold28216_cov31-Tisochrysis_lutea.AAC.2
MESSARLRTVTRAGSKYGGAGTAGDISCVDCTVEGFGEDGVTGRLMEAITPVEGDEGIWE